MGALRVFGALMLCGSIVVLAQTTSASDPPVNKLEVLRADVVAQPKDPEEPRITSTARIFLP